MKKKLLNLIKEYEQILLQYEYNIKKRSHNFSYADGYDRGSLNSYTHILKDLNNILKSE